MLEFIPFSEARRLILDTVTPQPALGVALNDALGYTLAEPVVSREFIPPFDNSAMDGFAVRVDDLKKVPVVLTVIENIPAGSTPTRTVEPGTCARIMTGAPFPKGADAVAPVEWTEPEGNEDHRIRFNQAPTPGQHIRHAGSDVMPDQHLVESGTLITPPVIGMAATLGYPVLNVSRPPIVAVISTGDELVDIDQTPGPGQIRNANGPALAAQVRSAGGQPMLLPVARDNQDSIQNRLSEALHADVLMFSGGVSVGDYDMVKQELDAIGLDLHFWKVRQRPGKPLAFGLLQGRPVFGLPGNPVSSAMCFEQYVRPAIATMLGRRDVLRPLIPAILEEPIKKKSHLHYFWRGQSRIDHDGRVFVRTTGAQGSHVYSSVVSANCIIHIPEGEGDQSPGDRVQIEPMNW